MKNIEIKDILLKALKNFQFQIIFNFLLKLKSKRYIWFRQQYYVMIFQLIFSL